MLKRRLVIVLFALMLFPVIVSAQEESGCGALQEGYKCIVGEKGVTVYNEADLTSVFGIAPQEDNGAILVKYKDARNRPHDFGYLAGDVIKEGGNSITVTRHSGQPRQWMAHYWIETDSLRKIKAVQFKLNATERPQGKFVFDMVKDAAFMLDEDINRDTPLDSRAVATRDNGASVTMTPTELSFDITDAVILYNNNANDDTNDLVLYMQSKEPAGLSAQIKNLNQLTLAAAGPDVDFAEIKVAATPALEALGSSFADIKLSSQQKVELARGPVRRSDGGNNLALDGAYTSILMKGGALAFDDNLIISPGSEGAITLSKGDDRRPMLELNSGKLAIFSDLIDYNKCNLMLEDSACMLLNPMVRLDINPRGTLDIPLKLALNDPASFGYSNIYFMKFIREQWSEVAIKKGTSSFTFAYNMAEINPVGDWFNFGMTFSTEPIIYTDIESSPPRDIYYRFECELSTKKCFFINPIDPNDKTEVLSFTERVAIQCRQRSDCSAEKQCIDHRCRVPVTCDKLIDGGSVDLLFVSEGYTDYTDFKNDVRYMLGSASARGLFTVSPFSEIKGKFTVWTTLGATSRQPLDAPGISKEYLRDYEAQCNNDIGIVLSKNQYIRAHASLAKTVAVTMRGLAIIFVHEMGHAYADLRDEYLAPKSPNDPSLLGTGSSTFGRAGPPNCLDETSAISQWGSAQWAGCGGDCNQDTDECARLQNYYRPEENSIMKDQTVPGVQFNEPSKQAIRGAGELGAQLSLEQLSDMIRNNQENLR